MVGAINTAIHSGPDTLDGISVLKMAVQTTVDALFVLHTTSTTVYF